MPTTSFRYLTLALALALAGGASCGPSEPEFRPPTTRTCPVETAEYTVDRIEVEARESYGGQGVHMFMFDVRYFGSDPPACVDTRFDLFDADTGEPATSGRRQVATTEATGGWRTASQIWFPWPGPFSDLRIDVSSAGHVATDWVCGSIPRDCEPADAGAPDAGSIDGGTVDAGTSDASVPDGGSG